MAVVLLRAVKCAAVNGAAECKLYDERAKPGARSGTVDKKMVCSNMELQQVLPVSTFPNRTVTL